MLNNRKRSLIILILLLIAALGFVEWEDWLGLELRSRILIILADGALPFGSLTLLFIVSVIWVKGQSIKSKLLKVFLIIAGFFSCCFMMISIYFYPDPWHDVALYKNDDEYLIVQFNSFGLLGERTVWRLITTRSPGGIARKIVKLPVKNVRQQLSLPEFDNAYIANRDTLTLAGKLWHLQGRGQDD